MDQFEESFLIFVVECVLEVEVAPRLLREKFFCLLSNVWNVPVVVLIAKAFHKRILEVFSKGSEYLFGHFFDIQNFCLVNLWHWGFISRSHNFRGDENWLHISLFDIILGHFIRGYWSIYNNFRWLSLGFFMLTAAGTWIGALSLGTEDVDVNHIFRWPLFIYTRRCKDGQHFLVFVLIL